jgi:hypothetical protein
MPQRTSLAAALANAGGSTRRAPNPVPPPPVARRQNRESAAPRTAAGSASAAAALAPARQPGRAGTKPITVHLPAAVRGQLKLLAAERGRTLQDLMSEAFNDLFAKYGKPEIAPQRA